MQALVLLLGTFCRATWALKPTITLSRNGSMYRAGHFQGFVLLSRVSTYLIISF